MATPESELDYLSPDFDPTSLTVPKLRSVLVAHNITYPSSAKKPQLVELFNENVKPQAKNILNTRSRTKRTTRGIQDVPSSQASTVTDEGIVVPSRKTFDVPVARGRKEREPPETDVVEAGEEFTPEEQLALVRERASNGERDILPPRRKAPAQRPTGILKVAPLAVTLAMLGGLATVWRQEKIEVGYCGVGRPSTSLAGVELPDWASIIQPQCEPCPQHAYCYPELRTVCEPDFVLKPHPLSLGGLVPLPPTCEPDGEKARKFKAVADRAVEELRERNAKWECGELLDEDGRHVPTPELDEEALKQEMSNKRRKGMSQSEFEDLWKGAIGEIIGRDEVESNIDGREGSRRTIRSTSLARVPLSCAIRRSIRLALVRHLGKLVALLLFLASGGYARWTITYNRETEARAKQLASYALDRLAAQAALHAQDPHAYGEAYIPMGQLRDDVLRDEFSATRRQRLWERVQKKVEGNSNIRPMVREGRSGDVSRVWEWVGAIRAIEGVDGGSARRESSRFSLGPIAGSSPAVGNSLVMGSSPVKEEDGTRREMMQVNKWDEGRPIY